MECAAVEYTYFGDSETSVYERGTGPQGGIESCYVFVACMDWMLATMKLSGGEPVSVPVREEEVVQVRETIFADDASLYFQRLWRHVCCSVGSLECVRT
jgi:hypothetical protein